MKIYQHFNQHYNFQLQRMILQGLSGDPCIFPCYNTSVSLHVLYPVVVCPFWIYWMQYKIKIQFKYGFGSGQVVPQPWKSFIPLHGLFPETNFAQWMPSLKIFMTRICVWPLIKLISLTRVCGKLVDAQLIKKVHFYESQWQDSVPDHMNPFRFITLCFWKIHFNIGLTPIPHVVCYL